jgi:hypothetical protein
VLAHLVVGHQLLLLHKLLIIQLIIMGQVELSINVGKMLLLIGLVNKQQRQV